MLANLIDAGAPVACMVAKTWDRHVAEALARPSTRPWPWWAIRCATSSTTTCVCSSTPSTSSTATGTTRTSPSVLAAAEEAGAEALVLCDTNGGSLPTTSGRGGRGAGAHRRPLGIHCHNDAGCAVANSLVAVQAGVTQVRAASTATASGREHRPFGGHPQPVLKLHIRTIPADRLERLTPVAHHIAELVNIAPNPQQPYVGNSVSPTRAACTPAPWPAAPTSTSTSTPNLVGNGTRVVVSEMAGRSTLAMKAAKLGLELDGEVLGRVLDELKRLEHEGYHFEVADGSLELLLRRATGWVADFFTVESFRVITDHGEPTSRRGHPSGALAGVRPRPP